MHGKIGKERTMQTQVFYKEDIDQAAQCLRNGELVAFPTETVFGLGAIANNENAVKQVYKVKGRPSDNPLIVHLGNKEEIYHYAGQLNTQQQRLVAQLTRAFWPGPLTLIVPVKPNTFSLTVTGGLNTVAFRMPDHVETLKLIQTVGFPIVGPSANLSGKPSPTQVQHVLHDFDGKIAGIIASDPTQIGVESTVLDLTDERGIFILRPGAITKAMIEATIPELKIKTLSTAENQKIKIPKAPGMKYRHYTPHQQVIAVSADKIEALLPTLERQNTALITKETTATEIRLQFADYFSLGEEDKVATQRLFSALRYFDDIPNIDVLVVELLSDSEQNSAYRNRLLKASSRVIE